MFEMEILKRSAFCQKRRRNFPWASTLAFCRFLILFFYLTQQFLNGSVKQIILLSIVIRRKNCKNRTFFQRSKRRCFTFSFSFFFWRRFVLLWFLYSRLKKTSKTAETFWIFSKKEMFMKKLFCPLHLNRIACPINLGLLQ